MTQVRSIFTINQDERGATPTSYFCRSSPGKGPFHRTIVGSVYGNDDKKHIKGNDDKKHIKGNDDKKHIKGNDASAQHLHNQSGRARRYSDFLFLSK
nr:hypothetical protein Iba_chr10cCG12200 [Ipomoea batatas]